MDLRQEELRNELEEKGMSLYMCQVRFDEAVLACNGEYEDARKGLEITQSEHEQAFNNYYGYIFNRDYVIKGDEWEAACNKANSARFEHGQSGAR